MLSWKTDSGFKLVSFDGNAEGAAAGFRVGPGDGEAEAASLSGSGRAASDETFCDGFGVKVHIIGRGIDNGYGDEIGLLFGIQIDPGSGKRIFQGIVNQVLKDPVHPVPIGADHKGAVRHPAADGEAGGPDLFIHVS